MGADKVAVTGANGFIASWICYYLLQEGFEVVACVRGADLTIERNQRKLSHLTKLPGAEERLSFAELDMIKSSQEEFEQAFRGCRYVVHTASVIIFKKIKSKAEEEKVLKPAIDGTNKVTHACYAINKSSPEVRVERVVYTSSLGAVTAIFDGGNLPEGKKPGDEIVFTEADFVDAEDDKINTYSKSKVRAELAAWDFVNKLKEENDEARFDFATVIPPLVTGPSLSSKKPATSDTFLKVFNSKFMPGVPKIKFWVVDCRDVAKAHILALKNPEADGHRFLVGASYQYLHELYANASVHYKPYGYKVVTGTIPSFIAKMYGKVDSTVRSVIKLIGQKLIMDTKPAQDILKLEYRDMDQTVIDTCDSLIFHGYIPKKKKFADNYEWTPEKVFSGELTN